jgi:hypothetical protein
MAKDEPPPLSRGDLCHHGSNALPLYQVIFTEGGRAWVRDVNTGADAVVSLTECQRAKDAHDTPHGSPEDPAPRPTPVNWPDGSPRP